MFALTRKELTVFAVLGAAHALSLMLALVTGLFLFWALAGLALVAAASCALSMTAVRHYQSARVRLRKTAPAPL